MVTMMEVSVDVIGGGGGGGEEMKVGGERRSEKMKFRSNFSCG